MTMVIGREEYFPGIAPIPYEGPESRNPLAYRWYDRGATVFGERMEEYLRFAVAYWHSFCGSGSDPFGAATHDHPWDRSGDAVSRAKAKMDAAFEFITKLGVPYYCFHDFDLIDEGATIAESDKRLETMAAFAKEKQGASGVRLLWGTANLFSHPRYMNGAATNPDFAVVAWAGAQVQRAIDITMVLGGEHYLFWGGREGYLSLLNTDMMREKEHLARFLAAARDYARGRGFTGTFFIEPKPMEPSKHQYDYDAETVIGFLRQHDLDRDFRLNIEVNHATLAGHTFAHEVQCAVDAGLFGSIDANRGDEQNGWDTDQFVVNAREIVESLLVIAEAGGFGDGGVNFDAKVRRNSTDPEDLFIAHITAIDTFARALRATERILTESPYRRLRKERYASFDSGDGRRFEEGTVSLPDLRVIADRNGEPRQRSGKQELFEEILNMYQ